MRRGLLLSLSLAALVAGCIEVSPNGGGSSPSPQPGPGPVVPVPDTQLRRSVAAALAEVPRDECVKLFGLFTALASYVESGSPGVDSTGQLLQLTGKTLDNLAWAKGRYPRFREVIGAELNLRFKIPKQIADVRGEVVSTFREIAAGCRDAALSK